MLTSTFKHPRPTNTYGGEEDFESVVPQNWLELGQSYSVTVPGAPWFSLKVSRIPSTNVRRVNRILILSYNNLGVQG